MSISDWISIISSSIALVVTIIIAILQIHQSNRMEKFEKRQDERDENRHAEEVKTRAISFISNNYDNKELIPLCAIAAMYNELYYYKREMYREFCCCTTEVQNTILKYCGLDLKVTDKDIWNKCIDMLVKTTNQWFPDDKNIFYDGGKYIERSLTCYGQDDLPIRAYEFKKHLTDILADAYRENDKALKPIEQIFYEYTFGECDEIQACQIATETARYSAIYSDRKGHLDKEYGSPSGHFDEDGTMEDLFLVSLFEIYTHLVLNSESNSLKKKKGRKRS